MSRFKFPIGQLLATPGAIRAVEEAGEDLLGFVVRHSTGDWGDVCSEDAAANELAISQGWRILSAYRIGATGMKIWLLTEADRSATTVLLPDEY